MKQHSLSIRRRTHISLKLPKDYEDKLTIFQTFTIKMKKKHQYSLSQIGNVDQKPLTFNLLVTSRFLDQIESCIKVSIKTTDNEKNRFTVMSACTTDGGKLPPYVVFNKKMVPKLQFPKRVIIDVHPNGWFDDDITKRIWWRVYGDDVQVPEKIAVW